MNMLRLKEVINKTGLSRSSVYKYISEDKFPQPVHLGERTVAWVESEIEDWLKEKIKLRDSSINRSAS